MNHLQILYLPWEGISSFLRALSLSGSTGNAAAFLLYILISFSPLLLRLACCAGKRRKPDRTDSWLLVLSLYTCYLLYAFINPALLARRLPGELSGEALLSLQKAVCGGLWLTLLASWILLRFLRRLKEEEIADRKEYLYQGAGLLLKAVMILTAVLALYAAGTELWQAGEGLAANEGASPADWAFMALKQICSLIPTGFFLVLLNQIHRLLKCMTAAAFEEKEAKEARRLAELGIWTVSASVFCSLIWNGLLFLCMGMLVNVDYQWNISLFPLITAFAALILARYLREAARLRRENEMFI